jgi:hypothetical protein
MDTDKNQIQQPLPNRVYGSIIYWFSIVSAVICTIAPILSMTYPERNILAPQHLFKAIWEGASPEAIWQMTVGGFPGGHFWLNNLTYGDGIIQFGIVLGSFCAAIGLVATAIAYVRHKPGKYFWALLSFLICVLIVLAAAGIYQQAE